MRYTFIILLLIITSCRSALLYHPEKILRSTPAKHNLKYEDITFKTSDNILLNGWYIKSEKNRGTVIFSHGNGGNISHRLLTIEHINKLGFNLFIYDYRGYGKSQGSPTFEGLKKDGLAAWDYIIKEKKEKPQRVVIWGRSLGGSLAAYLASERECKALIVESTFISLKEIASDYCSLFPYLFFVSEDEYNTEGYLKKRKCPVLIIHSQDDELIPYQHGYTLFKETKESRVFLKLTGGHNSGIAVSEEIYLKGVAGFLDRYY